MGEANETKREKSQTFNELPNEVWMKVRRHLVISDPSIQVLHYLSLGDIGRVAQLSSRFHVSYISNLFILCLVKRCILLSDPD